MPLRSLPSSDAYPDNVAYPSSQPRGASARRSQHQLISHRGSLPPLGFGSNGLDGLPYGGHFLVRLPAR